jgi:hypothetical protein
VRLLLLGLLLLLPGSGRADPVDLLDPTPRWIDVAYEISPRDRPDQSDTRYTPKIRARLEPAEPGFVRITVAGRDVERVLLVDDEPVPGSFSDFVWVFDASSGAVVTATVSGTLIKTLDWGLFDSKVRAAIEVTMGTGRDVGFESPRRWLGQEIFEFCDDAGDAKCRLVPAKDYDSSRGYVNAVGNLSVRFGDLVVRTFSPLGEAMFSEVEIAPAMAAVRSDRLRTGPVLPTGAAAMRGFAPTPAVSAGPPGGG